MNGSALVITDNTKIRWLDRIFYNMPKEQFKASILTLGINPEYLRGCNPGKHAQLDNCNFVDVNDISEKIQERVREFYTDFIFNLPQKAGAHRFFCKDRNLWWSLDITEKCPVRSKIIYRLFYLEVVRRLIDKEPYDKIYIDLDDHLLAQVLLKWRPGEIRDISCNFFPRCKAVFSGSSIYFISQYIKNCFGVSFLFIVRSLALKINRIGGIKTQKKNELFFYTNYPSWWHNPDNVKASEKFFGLLPEDLAQKYPVSYVAWLFSLSPLKIFSKRSHLKRFFNERRMVLLENLLRAREKLSILSFEYLSWAFSIRDYFKRQRGISYSEFDISTLLYYEICNSLTHSELFNDILIESAFRRLIKVYSPKALVYRLEFSPFEKSMLAAIDGRCRTVAVQHSTLSKNLMSHSFASGEIPFHLEKKNCKIAMPFPDLIFTAGAYFRDIMIKAAFPEERIYICGPVRYAKLISYLKENNDKVQIRKRMGFSSSEKVFLVVMNWIEKEGLALIAALSKAEEKRDKTFHFLIRSHPHLRYDRKILSFLKKIKPSFRYSFFNGKFSLYDAVLISDVLIQAPSTLGYEAMAIGKMPIVYENRHVFNVNSLEELKGFAPIVCSAAELKNAIDSSLEDDGSFKTMLRQRSRVLGKFFSQLEKYPKEEFVKLLKEQDIID